ncbi:MAG: tRNA lysidine(34) synthetase TilS [Oscillospiraceae bacterium]
MNSEAVNTIKKFKMLEKDDNVMVCVSGGADSMALLCFFINNREKLEIGKLFACHVNHGLRGAASDTEASYVKQYCGLNDVPLFLLEAKMLESERPKGESVEMWARELRYMFFHECAESVSAKIATAHTLNDRAETLILNIIRGAGIDGASSIPAVRENIIRPLIEISREQTESYCEENKVKYFIDSTNKENICCRNIIRNKVLPQLVGINTHAVENIAFFCENARSAKEFVEAQARELLQRASKAKGGYSAEILRQADTFIVCEALKLLISDNNVSSDKVKISCTLEVVEGKVKTVQLAKDLFLTQKDDVIFFYRPCAETRLRFEKRAHVGKNSFLDGKIVLIEEKNIINKEITKENLQNILNNSLDCDKIKGNLVLRNRRDGDSFSSNRRKVTKSLKKLFGESEMTSVQKDSVPLLSDDEGVLWIYGHGVSRRAAISECTKKYFIIHAN